MDDVLWLWAGSFVFAGPRMLMLYAGRGLQPHPKRFDIAAIF
ncbi:MAG: hypothetical protein PHI13_10740 [Methylococcales bacterium]|nr:hypothetical protein [Methylococcales bacterium]